MQWNDPTLTLLTPARTVLFNQDFGDSYINDPTQCSGLDQAPIRSTIEDRPQTHGGILHTQFYGARHVTLSGTLLVRTASDVSTAVLARGALEDDLIAALDSILNTDGTLTWSGRSLTVRCDIPAAYSGAYLKTYVFGLVAADPTIS